MGHRIMNREEIIESAKFLRREGIPRVIVSMGSKGLLSITGRGVLYARAADIEPINTVGCGDSVVASYAMSYVMGEVEEKALVRACAVSAANATTVESANIPLETAEDLMNKIILEKMDI